MVLSLFHWRWLLYKPICGYCCNEVWAMPKCCIPSRWFNMRHILVFLWDYVPIFCMWNKSRNLCSASYCEESMYTPYVYITYKREVYVNLNVEVLIFRIFNLWYVMSNSKRLVLVLFEDDDASYINGCSPDVIHDTLIWCANINMMRQIH